ncbi:MAG: hypothetical protein ACUVV0_06000 [Anaerolineae bacterium]
MEGVEVWDAAAGEAAWEGQGPAQGRVDIAYAPIVATVSPTKSANPAIR